MKAKFRRAMRALLASARCTRGHTMVSYAMVAGLVALASVSAVGAFNTATAQHVQARSGLVAQLDGTDRQHADSLPWEIGAATVHNAKVAALDGQLELNAAPFVAGWAVSKLHGAHDEPATPHDPTRDPMAAHPEEPGATPKDPSSPSDLVPCEGAACPAGSGRCFVAGTPVATPAGLQAIETLEVGDLVWSRDDETGELAARPVVHKFVTPDRDVIDVTLVDGAAHEETLHATPPHPFHVTGVGWRPVAELAPGDRIDTGDGRALTVEHEASHATRETVFNLEVEAFHTYFVGEHFAWVHNQYDPGSTSTTGATPPVPGRVQSRINLAKGRTRYTPLRRSGQPVSAGWEHVEEGHFNRAIGASRSIFTLSPDDVKALLQSKLVVSSPATAIPGGQYVRTVDVGQPVGLSALRNGGAATSVVKVYTDAAGNLITAYPH